MELTTHFPLVLRLKKEHGCTSTTLWTFLVSSGVKFTFLATSLGQEIYIAANNQALRIFLLFSGKSCTLRCPKDPKILFYSESH